LNIFNDIFNLRVREIVMKIVILFFYLNVLSIAPLSGCPTCVGKIHAESPPFFSDEFYKPGLSTGTIRETKEQVGRQEFKKLIEHKRGKK